MNYFRVSKKCNYLFLNYQLKPWNDYSKKEIIVTVLIRRNTTSTRTFQPMLFTIYRIANTWSQILTQAWPWKFPLQCLKWKTYIHQKSWLCDRINRNSQISLVHLKLWSKIIISIGRVFSARTYSHSFSEKILTWFDLQSNFLDPIRSSLEKNKKIL